MSRREGGREAPAGGRGKALTLENRTAIETGVREGASKAEIGRRIGKDKSTVGKEIRLHRRLSYKCRMPLECSGYKGCTRRRSCSPGCPDYVPFKCRRRDRSPGACNGCGSRSSCRFDKYVYEAGRADREYRETLVESREGVNLTVPEAKKMAEVIKPLISRGQSPYQIIASHPELGICEKTLYNYIDRGVFEVAGIKNIDLRRKVSRRMPKKKARTYKKREDRSFLKGRTYGDYRNYMEAHPDAHVLQMDTVYNDVSAGPFIQTFKFIGLGTLAGVLRWQKTAEAMKEGVDELEKALGRGLFEEYAEVILTDRGSEFSDAAGIETRPDGTRRTRLFYCDPMQSGQKGSLEVNHELLRYIAPKGVDLKAIGLTCKAALDTAMSHVDSMPVKSLGGKSPVEYTRFMAGRLWRKLERFGISEIPKDEVTLNPSVLKPFIGKG